MLKARSQHMMRMNRTDLNKSTQMHQALIGRAQSAASPSRHDLIGTDYSCRHCSVMLVFFSFEHVYYNGAVHTGICELPELQSSLIQFALQYTCWEQFCQFSWVYEPWTRSTWCVRTSASRLRRNLSQHSSSMSRPDVVVVSCCCRGLVSFSGGRQNATWLPAVDVVLVVELIWVLEMTTGCGGAGGLLVDACCSTGDRAVKHQVHTLP